LLSIIHGTFGTSRQQGARSSSDLKGCVDVGKGKGIKLKRKKNAVQVKIEGAGEKRKLSLDHEKG